MDILEEVRRVAEEADCLHDLKTIRETIARMAEAMTPDLQDANPLVLSVLNGGIFFTSELLLHLNFPLELDSIKAGRYQGAISGGTMQWTVEPTIPVHNRTILVLDDILDEGITLAEIERYLLEKGAARVVSAVLIDKDLGRDKPHRADHIGLVTENRYLFGFGLDYKGHLRNWPGIYACRTVY
jgi:hypoxanthine phosphoribosyltransferase